MVLGGVKSLSSLATTESITCKPCTTIRKPVWQHKALLNEGLDDLAAEIEEANHDTDDY
jgi:hypothetical protein